MGKTKHSGEVADILTAAMASGSTGAFFDAIDAVDRKAGYNELLDSINTPPSAFALCRCGSQLVVGDSRIRLTDAERHAAADELTDSYGGRPYSGEVDVVIDAINAARTRADQDFIADWNANHLDCEAGR